MKLFKKLLPIATIASTAAIIVPMVTSCGGVVFDTSDINWEMTDIHDETNIENAEQYNNLVKEYFKTNKHFAEDNVIDFFEDEEYGPKAIKEDLEEDLKQGTITDYKFSFNIKISDVSLSPKTLNLGSTYGDVNGYVVNYTCIDAVHTETTGKVDTEKDERIDKVTDWVAKQIVTNCFCVIQPASHANVYSLFHKELDWKTQVIKNEKETGTKIVASTNKIKSEETVEHNDNETNYRDNGTYTENKPWDEEESSSLQSKYLYKVTFSI